MTEQQEGYTQPGPIRWESEESSDEVAVIVARTPEHPSTDRRFSLNVYGPADTRIIDETDPGTVERRSGYYAARNEVLRLIRAAWYEGGGGKRVTDFVEEVRMLADEVDERIEVFRHEYCDESDPERPMLPKAQKVYDIFEAAKVRAVNAAEGKEPRTTLCAQTVVADYARTLYDDVIYSTKPHGYIAEIEDTHRALGAVGFKPDHKIVLKMNHAYRVARRSLDRGE